MPETKKGGGGLKGVRIFLVFVCFYFFVFFGQFSLSPNFKLLGSLNVVKLQGLPKSVRVNTYGTIIYIGLNIGFFTVFFIVAISEFQKPASEYMNRNLM